MVVYWVRNTVNNKVYIGQTSTSLERRWYMHNWDENNNSLLHKAIKKHGRENFTIEVIHECETKEEMDFVEIFYIALLNTKAPNGYNLTDGGEGRSGFSCTEETKRKIGLANKGRPSVNAFKSGIENPSFGKPLSEEVKLAISKANLGHTRSFGNHNALGHVVSEESKGKMSSKTLARWAQTGKPTHCIRGHERLPENLNKNGACKICQKESNAARYPELLGLTPEEKAAHKSKSISESLRGNIPWNKGLVGTIKKTHCLRGHPRTAENLDKIGACKLCRRELEYAFRKQKSAALHVRAQG